MKTIVAIALIALVASSSASTLEMIEAREGPASGSFAAFQAFMAEFDRIYDSPSIMAERFAIFQANMADARESNIENPTAEYGITRFSDMTPEEWEAEFLTVFPDDSEREVNMDFVRVRPASSVLSAPPNSVDWTPQLNPIKDQKSCGSCWAFSAMSAVEGALVAAGKDNIDGSEQHLVDCAKVRSQGCRGGWMDDAIQYLAERGIRGQEDYPYKAKDGKCQEDEKDVIAEISALRVNCANSPYVPKDIKTDDCTDDETRARTAIGVQSIAINAKAMMNYKKGILDVKESKCKPKQLNHGVDIVGFDEEDGVPYYIIRNSWGSRWGMKGYMHIVANKNMCGIQAYQVEAEV